MNNRLHYSRYALFVVLALSMLLVFVSRDIQPIIAQTNQACAQLVSDVKQHLVSSCGTLGSDEMCYGHHSVSAEFVDDTNPPPAFDKEGDTVALEAVDSIVSAPLDPNSGEWGVSVVRVQGGELVGTADQASTFVVYGDVDLTRQQTAANGVATPTPKSCAGDATRSTALRVRPGENEARIQSLELGTAVKIGAISPDGAWVWALANGKAGWIPLRDLNLSCNLSTLPINNPDGPTDLVNLNNFQFSAGTDTSSCQGIPNGGIYANIGTSQKVDFTVNGVNMQSGTAGASTSLMLDLHATGTAGTQQPRQILTASEDKTARLWNATTGQLIRTFSGHDGPVYSVAGSADGAYVLTGSADKTARLWSVASGKTLRTLIGHSGAVYSVAFSPDGKKILTGSEDKTAQLWDLATGQPTTTFSGHKGAIRSVAYSPDGTQILTGSDDGTAILWDAASGQIVQTFTGHNGPIYSVAFSPSARYVLTGGDDHTTRLWDSESGQNIRTYNGQNGAVYGVAFSPDGRYILTDGVDQSPALWDIAADQVIRNLSGHTAAVHTIAFSPNPTYALTGSDDTTARLWNVNTGESIRTFSGHTGPIDAVAFVPVQRTVPFKRQPTTTCIAQLDPNTIVIAMFVFVVSGNAVISVQNVTVTLQQGTYTSIPVCYGPDGIIPVGPPNQPYSGATLPAAICAIANSFGLRTPCGLLPTPIVVTRQGCSAGQQLDATGHCAPVPTASGLNCPQGTTLNPATGQCGPTSPQTCDQRYLRNPDGSCGIMCPDGQLRNNQNMCVCVSGLQWNGSQCVSAAPITPICTGGQTLQGGTCQCPVGTNWNGAQCVSNPPPPPVCIAHNQACGGSTTTTCCSGSDICTYGICQPQALK